MNLRTLWRGFLNLFKKKPVALPEPTRTYTGTIDAEVKRIGLVVGHNVIAKGANNFKGESEYDFYKRILPKLKEKLTVLGYEPYVMFRDENKSYGGQCSTIATAASKLKLSFVMCCHFNSYNGKTQGTENLVLQGDRLGEHVAKTIAKYIHTEYGFAYRGNLGCKTIRSGDRGAQMLEAINNRGIPATLIEPCFGDAPSEFFDNDERVISVLTAALAEAL